MEAPFPAPSQMDVVDSRARAIAAPPPAPSQRTCPHCGQGWVQKHGFMRRKDGARAQRYLCRSCSRTFSENTGTPAARLRKTAEWNEMMMLLPEEIPLRKMAARLGVRLTTAFRWRHRAAAVLAQLPRTQLEGPVRVWLDLVQYSEKGSRTCNGPGSWGYWNWLRRGPRPDYWQPRPFVYRDWPRPATPRFRLLVEGRPFWVMTVQSDAGCESVVLGQGRLTAEMLAGGLRAVVAAGAEVFAHACPEMSAACEAAGVVFRDVFRTEEAAGEEGGMPLESPSAEAQPEPEQQDQGPASYRPPIRRAKGLPWWLKQFHGVAVRHLNHYLALFRLACGVQQASGTGAGPGLLADARHRLLASCGRAVGE